MPDKAIDLVDEAASKLRIKTMSQPPYYKEVDDELSEVRSRKEAAIDGQEFEKAARLRDDERKLAVQRRELEKSWREGNDGEQRASIGENEIAEIVSLWTGIPVRKLTEEESERLLHMEEALHGRVVGQDEAIKAVSRSIRRTMGPGFRDPNRPSGSFVFLGPTGVGKTETRPDASRLPLRGSGGHDPARHVGVHGASTQSRGLSGARPDTLATMRAVSLPSRSGASRTAWSLFDEIEKAHPDVHNTLLQVLEDGQLTDAQGRVVNFKNTVSYHDLQRWCPDHQQDEIPGLRWRGRRALLQGDEGPGYDRVA